MSDSSVPGRENKLRIGLLLDSKLVPAWIYSMIERIRASEYAEICVVLLGGPRTRSSKRVIDELAYRLYMRSEDLRFRSAEDSLAPRAADSLLQGVDSVALDAGAAGVVRSAGLDVLIHLGSSKLDGELLRAPRHGTWVLQHGDRRVRRDGPEGFWEVFNGEEVTGATLYVTSDQPDGELILAQTFSYTDAMLVKKTLNSARWKALSLIPRELETLHRLGPKRYFERVSRSNTDPLFASVPEYGVPRVWQLVPLLLRHFGKYLVRCVHNLLYFHQWVLFFDLRNGLSTRLSRFKRIQPPHDRIWADPHVVARDGKYHVFIEEFIFSKARGRIATFTIDADGKHSEPVVALESPYHLSYPFVFQWQGVDYMVPETMANGSVELYRCVKFPDEWVFDRTLIPGIKAADATIFEHEGRWWLFASVVENEGASSWDELFLFSADSPISQQWKSHPLNPLISDVRRARPGGRVFRHGGALYRPAQDSSRGYGSGMRIHRIVRLSETEYEEVEVSRLTPTWDDDLVGVHTLCNEGHLTVVDANRCRARYWDRATSPIGQKSGHGGY